ncbi:Zinc finger, SWIM-type [Phytophthora cactorum]|nr:Zinc finger, SWIM-type [Phytophthora cactorum]
MPANKFWNTSAPAMPTSDVKLLLESLKAKKVTHVTPTTMLHRTRCEFDSSPAAARRARARSVTTEGQDAELPAPQPRHGGGIRSSCRSIHFTTATAAYCGYPSRIPPASYAVSTSTRRRFRPFLKSSDLRGQPPEQQRHCVGVKGKILEVSGEEQGEQAFTFGWENDATGRPIVEMVCQVANRCRRIGQDTRISPGHNCCDVTTNATSLSAALSAIRRLNMHEMKSHYHSVPASRPYDDGVRRKHDFPASAQLEVNTARMENEGMPATGWPVNVRDLSCTCRLYQKFFACIHVLFALNLRGHIDRFDLPTRRYFCADVLIHVQRDIEWGTCRCPFGYNFTIKSANVARQPHGAPRHNSEAMNEPLARSWSALKAA